MGIETTWTRDRIRLKSKMNLMDDMMNLATVDASKADQIKQMKASVEWSQCIITEIEHTPYLLRYISQQTGWLNTHKDSFVAHVQPLIRQIADAYKTADQQTRTAVIVAAQPQIVDWVIQKELKVPTEEDLARIGVTEAHKMMMKNMMNDKAVTTDAGGSADLGESTSILPHVMECMLGVICQKWTWQSFTLVLVVFFVVPGEPTLVVPDIIPLKPTEWTEGLTVRPKEVLKLLVGSKVQELLFFELPTSVRSFVVL